MTQPSAARSRLRVVREQIGPAAESRLVMILVRHMSQETIAGSLSPGAEQSGTVDRARRLTIEIINRITRDSGPVKLAA